MSRVDVRTAVEATLEARTLHAILAVNTILPLPIQEMLARVEAELAENPVLEREPLPCPQCGRALEGILCFRCGHHLLGGAARGMRAQPPQEDRPPLVEILPGSANLLDHLEAGLRTDVRDPEILRIALHLVGYLDERGYFDGDIGYVAAELAVPIEAVEHALRAVQSLEPPGIGARSVRECLLLQLERLPDHPLRSLAQALVAHHLEAIARGQHSACAAALDVPVDEVHRALRYIREHTVPYPAEAFYTEHGGNRTRPEELAIPDVVIVRTESGYRVELLAAPALALRIHPLVRRLLAQGTLEPEEREQLRAQVRRGRLFIEAVRRRNAMLYRCAEFIVQHQRAFLDHGPLHLRPLTMSALARALGVWESTVSRTLAGKFVQLPDGHVHPFTIFFDTSLPVRERIKALITSEDPAAPLTDEDLCERLNREGWVVARRTVTKYREILRIPSARTRRRLHRLGGLTPAVAL
jgi:RNA polymerase sigma-54 factor